MLTYVTLILASVPFLYVVYRGYVWLTTPPDLLGVSFKNETINGDDNITMNFNTGQGISVPSSVLRKLVDYSEVDAVSTKRIGFVNYDDYYEEEESE